ncbi:MAG: 7-cyano-7-deazaguanine synthase QueC [Bacteroidota bacterium]|nr:7-cyano-7-deazaguanine synthase QueC [Bacteroidota bacterium]MDP4234220.1 7-cyano-7-deazaguanine synthase QueC [Bacteroidota bacterium]MDP4243410.1 7-cyano-7-deazaguanine synthase QueC [Bacteroidota bacterium]MDP4288109.1 7-cyano-7-deazaguanine synthase QueC [Bacteroidota bacterium]
MKSIVLLSGGMDSTLTATIARNESRNLAALHLNYRHRTENRELQAFHDVADVLGIRERLVVDIEFLREIGGSSLTDASIAVTLADLHASGIPSSYVPFRNGNFLAIAASWAEVIGANQVYIGAVEEDSSGYPDCRRSFFDAYERAIELGVKPDTRIRIMTPVIHLQKSEIVRESVRLGAPIERTWSCYQSENLACGECDSCALRLRGFAMAGVEDPIQYRIRPRYS